MHLFHPEKTSQTNTDPTVTSNTRMKNAANSMTRLLLGRRTIANSPCSHVSQFIEAHAVTQYLLGDERSYEMCDVLV